MKRLIAFPIIIIVISASTITSCKNDRNGNGVSNFFKKEVIDIKALHEQIQKDSFQSVYDIIGVDSTFLPNDYLKFYSAKRAVWFNKLGLNENGKNLLRQIEKSAAEGLNPDEYHFSELDSMMQDIETISSTDLRDAEIKLSHAYLKLSHDILLGKITPLDINKNWQNKNDTIWNIDTAITWIHENPIDTVLNSLRPKHPWYKKFRQTALRLVELSKHSLERSDLPEQVNLGDSSDKVQRLRMILSELADTSLDKNRMVWDNKAFDALMAYQVKYNLTKSGIYDSAIIASLTQKNDGALKQLGMNMERIRWLQKDFLNEFIWVNIPQMDVRYFEGDSIKFQMNAVVGRFSRKTPTLDSRLSDIVFNPPWFVPPTILKQEIVPGIARRGGSYLARRGLVARDRRGRRVNPSRINANNYRRFSISQSPGRNSALGSVKFNFPNKEAIFLHDTNHRGGFTRKYRASSSGCIRVHHPKDFARFILRDSIYFSAKGIDSIIRNRSTKSIKIKREIGVHLVYLTNAVDSNGRVIKVKDIYKWDSKLAARL